MLALACATSFVAFLDVTVVNLAFPDLGRDFVQASVSDLAWVITGYAVLFAALLSPAGQIADSLGRRRVFLLGVAGFTLASLACSVATGPVALAIARAVQGAAAAAMLPAALAALLDATAPEERTKAVGLWAAAGAIAAAAGPTLGGVLVDWVGWRAVFLINLPVGLFLVLAGRRLLEEERRPEAQLPDVPGAVLLAAGMAGLVLGLSKTGDWGWSGVGTMGSLAAGLVLTLLAVRRASKHDLPALDVTLWEDLRFRAANLAALLFGAAIYAWLLLGVLFLTAVWGYSELEAGLAVTPGALTAAAASLVVGRSGPLAQQRAITGGCIVFSGVAVWIMLALGSEPRFLQQWLWWGLVSGAAVGAVVTGIANVSLMAAGSQRFAGAAGLNLTARQLGGAVGVAVLAAVLDGRLGSKVAPYLDAYLACALIAAAAAAAFAGTLWRAGQISDMVTGMEGRPAPGLTEAGVP